MAVGSDDLTTLVAIGAITVSVIAVGGVLVRLIDRINKVGMKAREQVETIAKELADYKVEAAESYVSIGSLDTIKKEILGAIGDLTTRVNQLFVPKA